MDYDLDRKEMPKLTKKMIKDILYNTLIDRIIEQHGIVEIHEYTTIKINLEMDLMTTKEGARILNRDIRNRTKNRSCTDCLYSYNDDLYFEFCCKNKKHKEEANIFAENDPTDPTRKDKPCCKYYREAYSDKSGTPFKLSSLLPSTR